MASRGIIVDLETTGLDSKKDEIIELGIAEFFLLGDGKIKLGRMVGLLNQPSQKLTQEIKDLTGLDDDILSGQRIDWARVAAEWFDSAEVVVAHNAEFDRGFLQKIPEIANLGVHWACSRRHIPWRKKGLRTEALNYLAADHGFINPFAHRAMFDCATTFRLISPHIDELVKRSFEKTYLVSAVGSAYETKDELRNMGFKWDADNRVWSKRVLGCDLDEEHAALEARVYKGRGKAKAELVD